MNVNVIDEIPPDIYCTSDTVVWALPDSCWGWANPIPATAYDNCALDSIWNNYTNRYSAYALYPVGTTTVTWYAVDLSGNSSSKLNSRIDYKQ